MDEGKIRINMKCNPYACSNDGKLITFGHWEQTKAYLYKKDGVKLDETDVFELKQEQGPFMPTPESLSNGKATSGNTGTATHA